MKYLALLLLTITVAVFGTILFKNSQKTTTLTLKPESSPQATKSDKVPNVSKGQIPNIPFKLPEGFVVHTFTNSAEGARDLEFSPGGTLLVSSPTSNQVFAFPDKDQDGVADSKKVIIAKVNRPHGLAFYHGQLFVAAVDKVLRYNWDENTLAATEDRVLFSLPQNNDHNNRTITFGSSGKMYVSVGSTCNVCREKDGFSATVITSDTNGTNPQVFAKGLRNAPFLQFNPKSGDLWATEMGRDNLGDNIPPDEINIVRESNDYGWPNCLGDRVHDTNFDKSQADPCTQTTSPIFQIPAHSAPLGLTFINSIQFPQNWQNDLLIAYHGSWNKSIPTGYKVVHMKVQDDSITTADDFMTGFLPASAKNGPNSAYGRPVDLTFDKFGNLYLSDDKSGNIYIIQKQP